MLGSFLVHGVQSLSARQTWLMPMVPCCYGEYLIGPLSKKSVVPSTANNKNRTSSGTHQKQPAKTTPKHSSWSSPSFRSEKLSYPSRKTAKSDRPPLWNDTGKKREAKGTTYAYV